jgi:hypothetical protein
MKSDDKVRDEVLLDLEASIERYAKAKALIDSVNAGLNVNVLESENSGMQSVRENSQIIIDFVQQEKSAFLRLLEVHNAISAKMIRIKLIGVIIGMSVGMGCVFLVYSFLSSRYDLGAYKINAMSYCGGIILGLVYAIYDIRKESAKWKSKIQLMESVIKSNNEIEIGLTELKSHLDQIRIKVK